MSGQKIIEGLKDAIAGNFGRVTIEGQTWVRLDKNYVIVREEPNIRMKLRGGRVLTDANDPLKAKAEVAGDVYRAMVGGMP